MEGQNRELAAAYERVREEERVKTHLLHQMPEKVEGPVQDILSHANAICDSHDALSEEEFNRMVDDMLKNTNQVTALLDKLLKEAQGIEEFKVELE